MFNVVDVIQIFSLNNLITMTNLLCQKPPLTSFVVIDSSIKTDTETILENLQPMFEKKSEKKLKLIKTSFIIIMDSFTSKWS